MIHGCLSCVFLCLTAAPSGDLELSNPRGTFGYLGPVRPKGTGMLPGEIIHFTFDIKNLKFDEYGQAYYSIAIEMRDEHDKLFYEQRPYNSVARNFFGGHSLPCSAHVEIPLDAKPGMLHWKITVKDRKTNQTAAVAGKGKILPADFGIVQVGLFSDGDRRDPVSAVGVVGDALYLHMWVVGFGREKTGKQPDVQVALRVIDDHGKSTMSQPLTAKISADIDPKERILPFQFPFTMNRAGRYTIELTAEDRTTGKNSRIIYPIRVFPLE